MRKWSKILAISAGIALFVGCLLILGSDGAPLDDWYTANKIHGLIFRVGAVDNYTTFSQTQANYLWGVTPGTAGANKAVVLDGSKDITGINEMTVVTLNGGTIKADSELRVLPDAKFFVTDTEVTTSGEELNYLDGATSTATANKVLVLDGNKQITGLVIPEGGLDIGGYGETITAHSAELNFLADTASLEGTAQAGKAAVLGANKNLDTLAIAASGFKYGDGAGVTVTSTAAELNFNDGSIVGTAVANKTAVLGSNKDLDYLKISGGSGVDLAISGTASFHGVMYAVATYTTDQDIGTTHTFVAVNTDSTSVTLTLLPVGTAGSGRVYFFKKTSASNTLTIDGNGSETIDGGASVSATADNAYLQIIAAEIDGWAIIGNKDFS